MSKIVRVLILMWEQTALLTEGENKASIRIGIKDLAIYTYPRHNASHVELSHMLIMRPLLSEAQLDH